MEFRVSGVSGNCFVYDGNNVRKLYTGMTFDGRRAGRFIAFRTSKNGSFTITGSVNHTFSGSSFIRIFDNGSYNVQQKYVETSDENAMNFLRKHFYDLFMDPNAKNDSWGKRLRRSSGGIRG